MLFSIQFHYPCFCYHATTHYTLNIFKIARNPPLTMMIKKKNEIWKSNCCARGNGFTFFSFYFHSHQLFSSPSLFYFILLRVTQHFIRILCESLYTWCDGETYIRNTLPRKSKAKQCDGERKGKTDISKDFQQYWKRISILFILMHKQIFYQIFPFALSLTQSWLN